MIDEGDQSTIGRTTSGLVVLCAIRKQVEQVMEQTSEEHSSTGSASVPALGSCLKFLP